jgi:hypothetical protein
MGKRWWKKATGLSKAQEKASKKIGVPLSREGRRRKYGAGCAVVLFALLAPAAAISQAEKKSPADTAISEATAVLQKALDAAKDPADQVKLRAAIAALATANAPPIKPQNELISDFLDDTPKYKGRTLTFKLRYVQGKAIGSLRERVGNGLNTPFKGTDPKNRAELLLGVQLPAGLDVPRANDGEEVVITFECTLGDRSKGNVAKRVTRP